MFWQTKAHVRGNALGIARKRMGAFRGFSFLRGLFLTGPADRRQSLASLRRSVEESSLIPEIVWVRLVTERSEQSGSE